MVRVAEGALRVPDASEESLDLGLDGVLGALEGVLLGEARGGGEEQGKGVLRDMAHDGGVGEGLAGAGGWRGSAARSFAA